MQVGALLDSPRYAFLASGVCTNATEAQYELYVQDLYDPHQLQLQLDERADSFINRQVHSAFAFAFSCFLCLCAHAMLEVFALIALQPQCLVQQGGCVFEKDDTVASLSSIFKWSKASFAREGGIAAFVNKYKQVTQHHQRFERFPR